MAKQGHHFLHTDIDNELSTRLGMIVFVGVARKLGFKQKEVNDYLGITPTEHTVLLDVYNKAHKHYHPVNDKKQLFVDVTLEKRVVLKSYFVSNTLNIGKPKDAIVPIAAFGY